MANNNAPLNPPVARTVNVFELPLEELTPEQLQHRRKILETRKMEQENDERSAAESQIAAARKANADNMVQVHAHELANQAACTHIKPRGMGTALGGQKTHKGHYVFVCQYCNKAFSEPPQRPSERVPGHLMPDMSMVGGPH